MAARALLRVSVAMVAAFVATACDGGSPTPPGPVTPAPVPGATQVTGRERLAWLQPGNGTQVSFRAYVDDAGVSLDTATCVVEGGESQCSAPLPPMSDGVHTVEVVAVAAPGIESERSSAITLQKVTARAARLASALPDAGHARAVAAAPGLVVAAPVAEVVARGIRMPAQLAALPDGRLLVAEAGGRVRMLHPEQSEPAAVALEAGSLLNPAPTGPLAVAAHPDFAATGHAYLADLYVADRSRWRLRIVRLREVGGMLGEPATIFDAAVATAVSTDGAGVSITDGPRLAFGGDRLLYASLPPGFAFDGHPAASRPVPAIVRLTADGQTPAGGGLAGVTSHPLGFTWHPLTGDLLSFMASDSGAVTVHGLGAPSGAREWSARAVGQLSAEHDSGSRLLRVAPLSSFEAADLSHITALAAAGHLPSAVRLSIPTDLETLWPGIAGHLGDLVTHAGTLYAVVGDPPASTDSGPAEGMVVRLLP